MHSNNPIIPYISLCSGYEGIGLGLHRCIPNLRAVAYCEREAFAIANLVAKMEEGLLDAAPVFTDVTNFPWADYAPYMAGGILSFGWPCQPVSTAGKRKATEDERWLFDIIADGISILHPGMLFAENVEGLLSARMPDGSSVFGHCIERLESLHYKVAAGIFSASEVGTPHQRKRVFILAYDQRQRVEELGWQIAVEPQQHSFGDDGGDRCGKLADGSNEGLQRRERIRQTRAQGLSCGHATECSCQAWPSRPGEPQHGWEPPRVIVANSVRSRGEEPEHLNANLPSEPSGGDTEGLGNAEQFNDSGKIGADELPSGSGRIRPCGESPASTDGQCGQTQPSLGGDAPRRLHGVDLAELSGLSHQELAEICEWMVRSDNRTDELRLLGNGVVPATAERAFRVLMEELSQEK
jgi:DNA (cytosine-5)-methyltransferase 1